MFKNFFFRKEKDIAVQSTNAEHNEYTDFEDSSQQGNSNDERENRNITNSQAKIVLIATIVLCGLLVIVIAIIVGELKRYVNENVELCNCLMLEHISFSVLVFNSKRKQGKRSPIGSTRSVLTFSNPNYNGADGGPPEPKVTIWKRLKYDKAQVNNELFHLFLYDTTPLSQ